MQYGVSTATSQLTAIGAVYHLCGTLDVKTDLQVSLYTYYMYPKKGKITLIKEQ